MAGFAGASVTMVVWGLGCVDMDQAFTLLSFFGGARLAQGSYSKLGDKLNFCGFNPLLGLSDCVCVATIGLLYKQMR